MRDVVTVFGDSLNLNYTYADYFCVAFLFIMFFASLICMFAGKWKAAMVTVILIDLYNFVLVFIYGGDSGEFIVTAFLILLYSISVCAIAHNQLKIKKQLLKQQQMSIFNDAENQQQSELQNEAENEKKDDN